MVLKVHPHKIEIKKTPVNERELYISKCYFEFDEEITDDFIKEAYFTFNGETYKQIIINDECDFPNEILAKKGTVEIGVVAYVIDNEEFLKRYNPSPVYFDTWVGSLKDNVQNSEEVTPTDKEQMEQLLQDGLSDIAQAVANAENLDIDVSKQNNRTTITITKQNGTTKSENVNDGIGLQYNWSGTSLGVKREDGQNYDYVDLKGEKGDAGAISILIVPELPAIGLENTIYLVPSQIVSTGNIYKEYIYINNSWEELGSISVEVDLSNYYTKQEVNNLIPTSLSALQDDNTHRLVTDVEKTTWNNKSDFSGNYNDLTNKPSIPTKTSDLTNDSDYTTKTYVDGLIGNINTALDGINGEVI